MWSIHALVFKSLFIKEHDVIKWVKLIASASPPLHCNLVCQFLWWEFKKYHMLWKVPLSGHNFVRAMNINSTALTYSCPSLCRAIILPLHIIFLKDCLSFSTEGWMLAAVVFMCFSFLLIILIIFLSHKQWVQVQFTAAAVAAAAVVIVVCDLI